MANVLQAVRGMNDVLPGDSALWEFFEDTVRDVFRQYGYRNIRTPMVEKTELFVRGVGAVTDIVEKEMYTFDDNGESLSLRPEGTAPTVRAALEHNLLYDGPKRLWYSGPLFRHERPQKGRYRQYHTFGAEALGFAGPDIDVELLVMVQRLWQRLGLGDITLELNTIGSAPERHAFRALLVAHFDKHRDLLDGDSQRRLSTNPLRILDSKNPDMQPVIEAAPKLWDSLGEESRTLFHDVQQGLREAGIAFRLNSRLVRGLDYYNATVFEWVTQRLGTQGAVCSGGRYDGLFEQLGGKPTPGCGFGIGTERVLLLLQDAGRKVDDAPLAYVVHAGDDAAPVARRIGETLRDHGHAVVVHAGGGSFKSQMKKADASGARYALVIGDDEVAAGTVAVKPLRTPGEQVAVPAAALATHLAGHA
ncbi:MAG TPA: histidine--tRNA ligase [Casimicrobiaceae bacterium]|nr:histidine--tRNA ligase [Casimicrobiaceae bacterium]